MGIILEAEIQLTTNQLLQKITDAVAYTEYADYLRQKVIAKPKVHLHYGRLSVAAGKSFLKEGRELVITQPVTAQIKQPSWCRKNG